MSDSDFPSGPWTGFFTYASVPGKWRTDVRFTFENGRVTGDGNDSVGPFIIAGSYDAAAKECHWTKTYVGAHDVFYKGFREGKGIWGTWEIQEVARGGFQLWPLGSEGMENEAGYREESIPKETVTVGPAATILIRRYPLRLCVSACSNPIPSRLGAMAGAV